MSGATFQIPVDPADEKLLDAIAARVEAQPAIDRDSWSTPQAVVDELALRFAGGSFTLDVAASADNAKAPVFYTAATDGLGYGNVWKGRVFCNPPYSDIEPWVRKAISETRVGSASVVVMLLPSRTDQEWFRMLQAESQRGVILFPRGRVGFIPPTGVKASSNNQGSIVAVLWPPLPSMPSLCGGGRK